MTTAPTPATDAGIPDPLPNTRAHPYRGLSVQEVDFRLSEQAVLAYLEGREVYRRTDYLALRSRDETVLVAVRKASIEPLFSPCVEARVLAGPDEVAWVEDPSVDVGNATALADACVPGARVTFVLGRFQHVNFLWEPAPIPVRVTEVVPPHPPKLFAQVQQVVAFDENPFGTRRAETCIDAVPVAPSIEHSLLVQCKDHAIVGSAGSGDCAVNLPSWVDSFRVKSAWNRARTFQARP